MPGFWDYMKQFSDSQNEKLKTIYDRQFNNANMFANVIQNSARTELDSANARAGILGQQAQIANWGEERAWKDRDREDTQANANSQSALDRELTRSEGEASRKLQMGIANIEQQGANYRLRLTNEHDFALSKAKSDDEIRVLNAKYKLELDQMNKTLAMQKKALLEETANQLRLAKDRNNDNSADGVKKFITGEVIQKSTSYPDWGNK